MASQNEEEFKVLEKRQLAILQRISALQTRTDAIQQTQAAAPSQFDDLQARQNLLFQRLSNISQNINRVAKEKNISLPAVGVVNNIALAISEDIRKRQEAAIVKLKMYNSMANSIAGFYSSEKKEQFDNDNPFNKRMDELKSVSECLRELCIRLDDEQKNKLTMDQLQSVLEKVTMQIKSVSDSVAISSILSELKDSNGYVEYNTFLDLIFNTNKTEKLANSSHWNTYRSNLIGEGRVEGSLRIFYRYDGWPEACTLVIKNADTVNQNDIAVNLVLNHIRMNVDDKVEYSQLRYATNPTFVSGKRGWNGINTDSESIPFLVHNDGTLEVDIWLRTQSFLANKGGRPMPEK